MRRLVVVGTVLLVVGFVAGRLWQQAPVSAEGQGGGTPKGNGDVNGDGAIDISDGIYVLSWLFTGGPAPKPIECPPCDSCCPSAGGGATPATGQTQCYGFLGGEIVCIGTGYPGQDGFYRAGCPTEGRFLDNGDGTVTDNCTGLMWLKETADLSKNGSTGEEDRINWQGALKYCENLDVAGHKDWRLPNVRELQSIVDYGRFFPSIDPVFESQTIGYWSSSTSIREPSIAWYVHFHDGSVNRDVDKNESYFVRAVRDAP